MLAWHLHPVLARVALYPSPLSSVWVLAFNLGDKLGGQGPSDCLGGLLLYPSRFSRLC
jgi:hypothetical protein